MLRLFSASLFIFYFYLLLNFTYFFNLNTLQLASLLGLSPDEISAITTRLGFSAFTGKQIAGWMYGKNVRTLDEMSNIPNRLREALAANGYEVGCSKPVTEQRSVDGTIKYLYRTAEGHYIETVYIPNGDRATLCVSSQVGCKMNCAFCMTGRQGYVASLSASDILNQIYSLPERETLTNIVFMGQGEPFDNLDNVLLAIRTLTEQWGYAWSPKRITVSSVGLAKGLRRFLDESKCHLAISLHHPIPAERGKIMPAEKAMSIEDVVHLLEQYPFCRRHKSHISIEDSKQRRLSFEYIVFRGMNDTRYHADALIYLLRNLDCRVNLIRFHDIPNTPFLGADDEQIIHFRDYLTSHGLFTTIRASRGQDIFAACGLLTTAKQEADKHCAEAK